MYRRGEFLFNGCFLSRLLALSHPERVLTKDIWERVLSMDAERLSRLETR